MNPWVTYVFSTRRYLHTARRIRVRIPILPHHFYTFAADSHEKEKRGVPGDRPTPLGPWGVGMRPEAASGPGQGPWGSGGEPCVCEAGESLPLSLSTPKRTRLAAQPHSPSAGSPCTASRPAAGWWRRPASGGCTPSAPSRHGRTWQKGIISVKLKTLDGTKH